MKYIVRNFSIPQFQIVNNTKYHKCVVLCRCLYLCGMWLDFSLKMNTKKDTCYNKIVLCAQNEDTILGRVVSIVERTPPSQR